MWYINTMEYYLAIKRNKILIYARTWMNLETLSERSQAQKATYIVWFHLNEMSRRANPQRQIVN